MTSENITILILAITAYFIYRQFHAGSIAVQFQAISKMQEMVEAFQEQRKKVFKEFPIEIVLSTNQFAKRPPGRHVTREISALEADRMKLSDEQEEALLKIDEGQRGVARDIINRLNDLGQLMEDGLLDRRVLLGKYHVMIIRLCYVLEPIRREMDGSGNYGQRLLRMRHRALVFNRICPKHRRKPIRVDMNGSSVTIVEEKEPNAVLGFLWYLRSLPFIAWY